MQMNFTMEIGVLSLLTSLILILPTFPKKKMKMKTSKFECGFNPISISHPKFSIQFFLICLMFVILDMEIIVLIPSILILSFTLHLIFFILIFLIILTVGLKEEWKKGTMEWSK